MRKLATIQKIINIAAIKNADKIEVATIEGWHCVVEKNKYKVNDTVIFIEYDSILPKRIEFDFMAPRKYKVKTIKLRGIYSQGLVFSINDLPETKGKQWEVGDDLTELLKIRKNEPDEWNRAPVFSKKDRGFYARHIKPLLYQWVFGINHNPSLTASFPAFIPKTDETRVEWMRPLLASHKGKRFVVTEKLDGSSLTAYYKDGHFGVCSHNRELLLYTPPKYSRVRCILGVALIKIFKLRVPTDQRESHFWKIINKLGIDKKLPALGKNIAIQGEIVGLNINGNKLKLTDHQYYIFSIFDIDNCKYFTVSECLEMMDRLGVKGVPILNDNLTLNLDVDDIIELSKGNSILNSKVKREGIVLRPFDNINGTTPFSMISFKAINPLFLLENDE